MRTMRAVWKDFGVVVYDTKNKSRDDKSASKIHFVVASLGGRNNAVISLLVCNYKRHYHHMQKCIQVL